jgi:hypothetical protein
MKQHIKGFDARFCHIEGAIGWNNSKTIFRADFIMFSGILNHRIEQLLKEVPNFEIQVKN